MRKRILMGGSSQKSIWAAEVAKNGIPWLENRNFAILSAGGFHRKV